MKRQLKKMLLWFLATLALAAAANGAAGILPGIYAIPFLEMALRIATKVFIIIAGMSLLALLSAACLALKGKPAAESMMINRLYGVAAVAAIALAVAHSFGKLSTFGTLFTLFGGMVLGWSLQAPVSGFAAWVLVAIKRPFRPGDRIQMPNLGLTGDVKEIGAMYVVLDQVGGTVGSEDAVGRHILVPNAMLFSQVVINFTVIQEAAYMLDEVVVRITYDSDIEMAERILLDAAREISRDIIKATGAEPYIRSDLYDYGIYLRLRYQTLAKDRPKIAYQINKLILERIKHTPEVDLAIPFVYSYKAGYTSSTRTDGERKGDEQGARVGPPMHQIDVKWIVNPKPPSDPKELEPLMNSIIRNGLLQPIVVQEMDRQGTYGIAAGHARFEACKALGWKMIPAIIRQNLASAPEPPP